MPCRSSACDLGRRRGGRGAVIESEHVHDDRPDELGRRRLSADVEMVPIGTEVLQHVDVGGTYTAVGPAVSDGVAATLLLSLRSRR